MKGALYFFTVIVGVIILGCQKIEVPTEIKSFYPDTIDGVSYVGETLYEVEKADGESFEIKLTFEGGSGYEEIKILNRGINIQTGYHGTYEASEAFNVIAPEKGSTKGSVLVSGIIDYNQYWPGIQSSSNKYSFYYYLVDQMGVTRALIITFVKP